MSGMNCPPENPLILNLLKDGPTAGVFNPLIVNLQPPSAHPSTEFRMGRLG